MDKTQIRNLAMSKGDLNKLKCELGKSKSPNALRAIEISSRVGLRVNEVNHLRFDHIDLEKGCIHAVEGTKNGKKRDVPIREKDLEFFWDLKYSVKQKSPYVCGGILPDSINKAIRRAMEETGLNRKYINTTEHAVRKLYATERWNVCMMKERHGRSCSRSWGMGTGSGRICFGRILRFEGDRRALGGVRRLIFALPLEKL